jgi:hypothetical protein
MQVFFHMWVKSNLLSLSLSNIIAYTYKVCNNDWLINIESWRDSNMFDDTCLKLEILFITTKVVSSNTFHVEVCSKQDYVTQFVNDLRQVSWFFWDVLYNVFTIKKNQTLNHRFYNYTVITSSWHMHVPLKMKGDASSNVIKTYLEKGHAIQWPIGKGLKWCTKHSTEN